MIEGVISYKLYEISFTFHQFRTHLQYFLHELVICVGEKSVDVMVAFDHEISPRV